MTSSGGNPGTTFMDAVNTPLRDAFQAPYILQDESSGKRRGSPLSHIAPARGASPGYTISALAAFEVGRDAAIAPL